MLVHVEEVVDKIALPRREQLRMCLAKLGVREPIRLVFVGCDFVHANTDDLGQAEATAETTLFFTARRPTFVTRAKPHKMGSKIRNVKVYPSAYRRKRVREVSRGSRSVGPENANRR